ncbi:MAG: hypothetical protein ACUVUF_06000 [Candidatus Bathycorpusculaceae bacterium]
MKELMLTVPDGLYKYLTFLEKTHFIKSKEEALTTALEFYKKLAMHDWLPNIYRMGGGRVVLMDTAMISDLFHGLSNLEIFNAGKASALKRKLTNPYFRDVDFSNQENWSLVLSELEIMGWGKFSRVRNEIKAESCPLPALYLQGYFEGMFGLEFERHPSKIPNISVFMAKKKK